MTTMQLNEDVLYLMSLVLQKHFDGISRDFLRVALGRSEWRCLAVLAERDGCTVSELVELTQQPQTTISKVIGRMERDGYLTRSLRESDGRFVELRITPKGREKLAQVLPIVQEQHEVALDGLSARELREFKAVLLKMLENLGAEMPVEAARATRPVRAVGVRPRDLRRRSR